MTNLKYDIDAVDVQLMYDTDRMTQQEIADYYGCTRGNIYRIMKEYDMKTRPTSEYSNARKYSINEDFFKTWTSESSWLYGWALGDGSYTRPLCFMFYLSQVDREVLFKFKSLLKSEHNVVDYKVWNEEWQKYSYASQVQFYSKELVTDLNNISYADIPINKFSHFLRGFFEAEGSVYWYNDYRSPKGGYVQTSFTNNDIKILEFIHFTLKDYLNIVEGGGIYHHNNGWQLKYSESDSLYMYQYMYENCSSNFLKRKKEKFEELIDK